MRIISGFLKNKKIDYLKTSTTRPLRDFVRESIFNVVMHSNLIDVSIENTNILDLYSGVGSFGIECVSRGAKNTTFVEKDNKALEILKKNIDHLKIEKKSKIFSLKIISFFNQLNKNDRYGIIFFDPPFSESFFIEELKIIKNSSIFEKDHLVIIHRERKSKDELSGVINVIATKNYGRSKVIFGNFNSNIV